MPKPHQSSSQCRWEPLLATNQVLTVFRDHMLEFDDLANIQVHSELAIRDGDEVVSPVL
jgi:hypothetical protein